MGRVLKRLAPHECGIADTDLTFLWNLTQKVALDPVSSARPAAFKSGKPIVSR